MFSSKLPSWHRQLCLSHPPLEIDENRKVFDDGLPQENHQQLKLFERDVTTVSQGLLELYLFEEQHLFYSVYWG